jgi:RNA polymerase sigma-70 factor (ECF subfamily)
MNEPVASVVGVPEPVTAEPVRATDLHADDRAWLSALGATGSEREFACARLHALLLRAARFELNRRRAQLEAHRESIEDLAVQSADNALSAILGKLDSFRFESRFTTWAYKFAILEAAVLARRRAWQERELPVDPHVWSGLPARVTDPAEDAAVRERLRAVTSAIKTQLSPHQREVLTALVLADVPIDVLAERLNTTRGALYKTLHDARRRLRAVLDPAQGADNDG